VTSTQLHGNSLDIVLPADLLEGIAGPGGAAATQTPAAVSAKPSGTQDTQFAVTSTGLRPLKVPEALEELYASLAHCLQPHGPLMPTLHSVSGPTAIRSSASLPQVGVAPGDTPLAVATSAHHALISGAQQLCSWTLSAAARRPGWSAPWSVHLLQTLQMDSMLQLLHSQLVSAPADAPVDTAPALRDLDGTATAGAAGAPADPTPETGLPAVNLRGLLATPAGAQTPQRR
jgi:hypothetical protein